MIIENTKIKAKTALLGVAVSTALSVLVSQTVEADQDPLRINSFATTKRAETTIPYSIALSLGHNWNTNYTGLLVTTVTFANSGQHALVFALTSPLISFIVEYKAVRIGLAADTGWEMLKFTLEAHPANGASRVNASQNHVIIGRILPRSHGSDQYTLVGFPMSKEGFYRITAITKIPNTRELDGSAESPVVVRTFTLNLRSNSIIVQLTPKGFVEVPSK